jgi:hypothetical protein
MTAGFIRYGKSVKRFWQNKMEFCVSSPSVSAGFVKLALTLELLIST